MIFGKSGMSYKLVISIVILFMGVLHLSGMAGHYEFALKRYALQANNDSVAPTINREMLDMFERFKQKGSVSESFLYRFSQRSDSLDAERFRQLLEEYRGAVAAGEDPLEHDEFVDFLTEEVEAWMAEEENDTPAISPIQEADKDYLQETAEEAPQLDEIVVRNDTNDLTTEEDTQVMDARPEDSITGQSVASAEGKQNMVRYHIQIAASTEPLQSDYLNSVYSGPLPVNQLQEEDWFKYYVGTYYSFVEAREELKNVHVNGAFIKAYVNDYKLMAYKGRMVERIFRETALQTFHNDPEDQYRVQIAASVRPLTDTQLTRILPRVEIIGIIFENGWFKYSIPGAYNLQDSWRIARETNIEGAYVVRYRNGRLLPLR